MRKQKERIKRDWDHWKPTEEEAEELSQYHKIDLSDLSFENMKPLFIFIAVIFTIIAVFHNISDSSITDNAKNVMESITDERLTEDMDKEDTEDLKEIQRLIEEEN